MPWAAIFALILELLQNPQVQEWLRKLLDRLFNRAARRLPDSAPASPAAAAADLFDCCDRELPRFAPARRIALRAVRRAVLSRLAPATSLPAALEPLTADEVDDINLACEAAENEMLLA